MIVSVGCSFTYGEELSNQQDAWPHLVSSKLGKPLINLAEPGTSTDFALRTLIEYIANETPEMILIGWTMPGRCEFSDIRGYYCTWPGYEDPSAKLYFPWRKRFQRYFDDLHDEKSLLKKWYQNLICLQSFLKSRHIPCVFVLVWKENFYYEKYRSDREILKLHKLVDWSMFTDQGELSMVEYTYGCAEGPRKHFLEEGHKKVADKVLEYLRFNQ